MISYLTSKIFLHNRQNNFYAIVSASSRGLKQRRKKSKNKETEATAIMLQPPVREQKHTEKKLIDDTQPQLPHLHPNFTQPSTDLSHLPIICNNNKMDMTLLIQMRQSDKYGSVRNHKIINFHLGSGAGLSASIPWLLQDPSHI